VLFCVFCVLYAVGVCVCAGVGRGGCVLCMEGDGGGVRVVGCGVCVCGGGGRCAVCCVLSCYCFSGCYVNCFQLISINQKTILNLSVFAFFGFFFFFLDISKKKKKKSKKPKRFGFG
jgi:hypothetical protein